MPAFVLLQHHICTFMLIAVFKLFAAAGVFNFDFELSIVEAPQLLSFLLRLTVCTYVLCA